MKKFSFLFFPFMFFLLQFQMGCPEILDREKNPSAESSSKTDASISEPSQKSESPQVEALDSDASEADTSEADTSILERTPSEIEPPEAQDTENTAEKTPQPPEQEPTEKDTINLDCRDPAKFRNLDYGLYWYGDNTRCEKFIPGRANTYYDPQKPVLIYIHGWKKKSVVAKYRESFDDTDAKAPKVDFSKGWKDKGWNVAIFHWNQFADELEVKDAEAKIWSAQGPQKMRWLNDQGKYSTVGSPKESMAKVFVKIYLEALANHQKTEIRFAGHSLGSQFVVAAASEILENYPQDRSLLPTRIALLDPAYLRGNRSFLQNRSTAEVSIQKVRKLIDAGVVLESYRSSGAVSNPLIGNANYPLLERTAFTELKPYYFSSQQFAFKHMVAKWYYFWSISFPPPKVEGVTLGGASASQSLENIKKWMKSSKRLIQVEGRRTPAPSDDVMTLKNK